MSIRPLQDTFLFQFLDGTTSSGRFRDTYGTKKIEVVTMTNELEQIGCRWGQVIFTGPKVTEFHVGDFVLIDSMKWTKGFEWHGETLWKSDQKQVLAASSEPVFRH